MPRARARVCGYAGLDTLHTKHKKLHTHWLVYVHCSQTTWLVGMVVSCLADGRVAALALLWHTNLVRVRVAWLRQFSFPGGNGPFVALISA